MESLDWTDVEICDSTATFIDNACSISYDPEYALMYSRFRALMAKNEFSSRSLALTSYIIEECPAHYTAWYYRQLIVQHLASGDTTVINQELAFLDEFTRDNKKNYQIWNYRQFLIEMRADAEGELEFVEDILSLDSKNYHAWTYRQWLIKHFNLWDDELQYIERLLQMDIRNNSAWNQRFFVVSRSMSSDLLKSEVEYTLEKIQRSPLNESSWTYLRGLFTIEGNGELEKYPGLLDKLMEMFTESEVKSPHLLALLYDINKKVNNVKQCRDMLEQLKQVDKVRYKYWDHLLTSL